MTQYMTRVTTYIENGRRFVIAKQESGDAKGYWGIEEKYFDENGKLTRAFNGITGNWTQSAEETIKMVSTRIKVDALVEKGWDINQAVVFVLTGKKING